MPIIKTYMVPHPPLIIPEIGKGGENQIKKTTESYEQVAKEISKRRTFLLLFRHEFQKILKKILRTLGKCLIRKLEKAWFRLS